MDGNDFTVSSKAESNPSDVEVGMSYEKRPTMFDVVGVEKYEKRNSQGKLVDGVNLRWVDLKTDKFNYYEKVHNDKFEPCLVDDIKVPFAESRKKGEPWVIKNGNEEMMLMRRSVEENDKVLKQNRARMQGSIAEASKFPYKIPGGNSSFTFQSSRSPVSAGPKMRTGF